MEPLFSSPPLFGRAADAALEGQALIALFEHHVDDTADGIGAIDGRATIQVHFHSFNRRHGNGVQVDGGTTHGGRAGDTFAIQQDQGALRAKAAQAYGSLGLKRAAGGGGYATEGVVGGLLQVICHCLLT